jgi:hypothetical protein
LESNIPLLALKTFTTACKSKETKSNGFATMAVLLHTEQFQYSYFRLSNKDKFSRIHPVSFLHVSESKTFLKGLHFESLEGIQSSVTIELKDLPEHGLQARRDVGIRV